MLTSQTARHWQLFFLRIRFRHWALSSAYSLMAYVIQLTAISMFFSLLISKIFRAIKSSNSGSPLQPDVDSEQGWCSASFMKLSISKTRFTVFPRETNTLMKFRVFWYVVERRFRGAYCLHH
jgi:hypothetical protein